MDKPRSALKTPLRYWLQVSPCTSPRLVVGVFNRSTNTVTLCPTTAHVIDRSPISPPEADSAASTSAAGLSYHATRAALGQAFGNSKAKRAIADFEKRMIDPRAVSMTIDAMQDNIGAATGTLPVV